MVNTVIGFFDNASEVQTAVQRLQESGISRSRIDVSSGHNTSFSSMSKNSDNDRKQESGITRFFKNLFGSDDDETDRYSQMAQRSNSMITVHAQSSEEAERAADILDDCGAIDVDQRAAQFGYKGRSSASHTGDTDTIEDRGAVTRESETSIPRIQEELQVGKLTEERGGVRVRSRIVERPVEENVRLREAHVHVERTSVNRSISDYELPSFKDGDIELTERAEVPVVTKEARVVEEVRVSKDVEERNETIRDTVRNTEVDVQYLDDKKDKKNYDRDDT
jgi:stress response protein YsnF